MKRSVYSIIALATLLVFTGACATKKYVRQTVDTGVQAGLAPVKSQVGELEETSRRNSKDIKDLDARLSGRIDEVSKSAERANSEAQQASLRAAKADEHAAQVEQREDKKVAAVAERAENIENYSLAQTVTVNFAVGKSVLNEEAKANLDGLASQVANSKGYVLEIEGFTDKTGSQAANHALSQRRADAVQAYLVEQHSIPLFRVRIIGLGDEKPVAENKTKAGRAQNRRVEVRLLTNGGKGASAS